MKRDEHAVILANILGNPGDVAKVSEDLSRLSEDYGGVTADLELTKAENATLKAQNETIIKENMRLFLKIGKVPDEIIEEAPDLPPTFESLFTADGKLK